MTDPAEPTARNPGRPPRKQARNPGAETRARLLDAAEQLFAQQGIATASLRDIATLAGQKNTSAAHYHFKDRQGLVDALLRDRLGKVEQGRQRLMAAAGDLAGCDGADLLRMLWQPMLDISVGRGRTWLIQFHLSYHLGAARGDSGNESARDSARADHPIAADPPAHPASTHLLRALFARYPRLPAERMRFRLGVVFMMFWTAFSRQGVSDEQEIGALLNEVVAMADAALMAPA